jgi:HEPN domain-containing protein
MSDGADRRGLPEDWLGKAEGDLAAAQTLLRASVPRWTAAFHAQQCVEKCLKAVLVAHGRAFPKSHDIRGLILLLPASIGLEIDRRLAAELTESAVTGRYPGAEDPDTALTESLVAEAQRIVAWVRAHLASRRP